MTLFVSSYSASFAPGTFLVHSGDSAKASSALQLLDTRFPDHDPELVVLCCPASVKVAREKSATRQSKKRFALESDLTNHINSNIRFIVESAGTVHLTASSYNVCQRRGVTAREAR